jgi:hypothetical protein
MALLIIVVVQPLDYPGLDYILKDYDISNPTVLVKLNNSNDSSARVINPIVITPL